MFSRKVEHGAKKSVPESVRRMLLSTDYAALEDGSVRFLPFQNHDLSYGTPNSPAYIIADGHDEKVYKVASWPKYPPGFERESARGLAVLGTGSELTELKIASVRANDLVGLHNIPVLAWTNQLSERFSHLMSNRVSRGPAWNWLVMNRWDAGYEPLLSHKQLRVKDLMYVSMGHEVGATAPAVESLVRWSALVCPEPFDVLCCLRIWACVMGPYGLDMKEFMVRYTSVQDICSAERVARLAVASSSIRNGSLDKILIQKTQYAVFEQRRLDASTYMENEANIRFSACWGGGDRAYGDRWMPLSGDDETDSSVSGDDRDGDEYGSEIDFSDIRLDTRVPVQVQRGGLVTP
jgi:hypothetical protein